MELLLDGHPLQALVVEPSRRIYQIGPLALVPGSHQLLFHPAEAPTVVRDVVTELHDASNTSNRDRRALSFAFGEWNWSVRGERP